MKSGDGVTAKVRASRRTASSGRIWAVAAALSVGWLAAVAGVVVGAGVPLVLGLPLLVIVAVALAPVMLIWSGAGLAVQSQRLAAEVHRTQALTDTMLAPSLAVAGDASRIVAGVRIEVEQLEARVVETIQQLSIASERLRLTAESNAADARRRIDELSEAAFAAGRTANQVFEARIADADAMVRRSAELVDEVAGHGAARLSATSEQAQAALRAVDALIDEVDSRAAKLPRALGVQAEQVRVAVSGGLTALAAEARRTAEQAALADEALQARVRRNFEMLSETVKLMGMMASAAPLIRPPEPAPPLDLDPQDSGEAAELERPRLRLAPTERDQAYTSVFAGEEPPPAAAEADLDDEAADPADDAPAETWTWSDLLASLGDGEAEAPRDAAGAALEAELAAMGVDPATAPSPELVLEALGPSRHLAGVRDLVRRQAPAQIRRVERRLQIDERLRGEAEAFVARGRERLALAAAGDDESLARMLASRDARLLLLLDAASETIA